MCGILGRIDLQNEVDESIFRKQLDSLNHRGPDGDGVKTLCNGRVVLGHKRLAIIDLSSAGQQPMCNEDGSVWITFNGEIYNYPELKSLLQANHIFNSASDTEVLIHGYEEWGLRGLLERLVGMFSFAIWDENKKKLFAARDRFGIKPFYYTLESNGLTFASEIKALVGFSDFDRSLDSDAIADFLVYRFIPSPKTIYKSVAKLSPASLLEYDFDSDKFHIESYWSPSDFIGQSTNSDLTDDIEQTLEESVKSHLLADVPVGVFLSGGYDSSALVHYMSKHENHLSTFSIGFDGWPNSEHLDARVVSSLYKTRHKELILDAKIRDKFEKYAYYYDEPLGGSSFMPTFSVAELAAQTHKVVLGGDGGDEIFAGYRWHYKVMDYRNSVKGRISGFLKDRNQLLRLYHSQMSWSDYDYEEVSRLLNSKIDIKDSVWLYQRYDQPKASDLKRLQLLDMHTFLPEVINNKVDRASMAHSLEVRVPFLNHQLAEKLLGTNESLYYQKGVNKKMLKSFLKPHLPNDILNKRKQGFGAPISYSQGFDCLLDGFLVKDGLLNSEMIKLYIEQKSKAKLWPIFILENWYSQWRS